MSTKLVDRLAATIGRRGFLGTLSAASAALVVGFFRIQGARAGVGVNPDCPPGLFQVACCCLALDPRSCSYSGCGCEWVWTCIDASTSEFAGVASVHQPAQHERIQPNIPIDPMVCRRYSCKECYYDPAPAGSCTGSFKCSKATYTTIVCAGVGG
jgi:hypothetical protein